ncbi:unnamed protein product [Haemonchus placei]|uniref:Bacteriophage protein n=1 Tax=Haemonchus placei TaxID=6290 RepID=A0A0N4WP69_HAEPC|nr:unnamed protein product [Haemonchus placei]
MDYIENLLAARSAFTFDEQIRYLGWALLFLWMFSITYMTREFWFPAAFGRLSENERPPPAKRKPDLNSETRSNYTNHDLRLLADVSRKKCEQYLLEKRRFSTND